MKISIRKIIKALKPTAQKACVFFKLLTVTVSPDPTLMTESGSFRMDSLKSFISLRVHMDGAAMGRPSTNT